MSDPAAHTRPEHPDTPASDDLHAYAAALVADWPAVPPEQIGTLRGLLYPDSSPQSPGAA